MAQWDATCYCMAPWKSYAAMIPGATLRMSKAHTEGIVRHHGRQRHGCGRFKRQALLVSTAKERVDVPMARCARFRVHGAVAELFLEMMT